VNQSLQPGTHPDADQLSVFVEGASTQRERERMLAHLAECEECRDAVFLMQQPVESPVAAKELPKEWIWKRWFLPVCLAAAALACGLTVMLVHVKSIGGDGGRRQIAVVQEPESQLKEKAARPIGNPAPAAQPEKATSGPRQGAAASHSIHRETSSAAGSNALKKKSLLEAADGISLKTGSAVPSNSLAEKAQISSTPIPPAQPSVNSAEAQELPLNGRNVTSLQALAPGAPSATPRDRSQAQEGLPALRVERPSGQDNTLSGVSGRVTDASGAVIPKATVVLRDAAGSTRQTTTAADGSFMLAEIPAGRYDLTVAARGFESNRQSIDLKPSELAMLQPMLKVGAVSETVTVASSAPSFETESASIGSIVAELPSRLRAAATVSFGKRMLSLDDAGSIFLSHNAGKSWKKVNPQWTGKAVTIDIETAEPNEAQRTTSNAKNPKSVFQLTTDAGAQWMSKDGLHWHPE
jgi:hypothetical protein